MASSHRRFSKTSSLARCEKTCLTGSFEVQIPRDICTRFGRYLYSTKLSWIINKVICLMQQEIHRLIGALNYITEARSRHFELCQAQ